MRQKWLIAILILGLSFGGGVLYGWSTRQNEPKPQKREQLEGIADQDLEKRWRDCRRELDAQARPSLIAPIEMGDAGAAEVAKVEALQRDVHECRARRTLQNAYVCGTIDDNINLLDVLMFGSACKDEARVLDFLLNSLARCEEFGEFPAHLDEAKLTQEEKNRLAQSEINRRFRDKNNLVGWGQTIRRKCRKRWALPDE